MDQHSRVSLPQQQDEISTRFGSREAHHDESGAYHLPQRRMDYRAHRYELLLPLPSSFVDDFAETILETEEYRGFPIVRSIADRIVVGYISRNELQSVIGQFSFRLDPFPKLILHFAAQARSNPEVKSSTPCYFTDSNLRGRQIGPRPSSRFEADSKIASPPTTPSRSEATLSESFNIGSGSATPEDAGWMNLRPWVDQVRLSIRSLFHSTDFASADDDDAEPGHANGDCVAAVPRSGIAFCAPNASRSARRNSYKNGSSLLLSAKSLLRKKLSIGSALARSARQGDRSAGSSSRFEIECG